MTHAVVDEQLRRATRVENARVGLAEHAVQVVDAE